MAMVFLHGKFGLLRGARQEMLPTGKAARFGRGPVPPGPLADTLAPENAAYVAHLPKIYNAT